MYKTPFANPVTFRGSTVRMQCSKYGLEVGRSFIQNRNIITDYHWLPHWKCTVNLSWTLLGHIYAKVGQKVTDHYFELCVYMHVCMAHKI